MRQTFMIASLVICLVLSLTGCRLNRSLGNPSESVPVDTTPTAIANLTLPPPETPEMQATFTDTPQPVHTPTPIPTPTVQLVPNQPATIGAANVNLRQGPGKLFQIMVQLAENSKITVIGKAPGDDWLYVDTGNRKGWVVVDFTSLANNPALASVPIQEVTGAQIIHGQVSDSSGAPISGLEFAAFQGKEDSNPPDTRAHSMADGNFYLYLPSTASGAWRVSFTAADCKSRVVDANCKITGAIEPRFVDVTVPTDQTISIKYQP